VFDDGSIARHCNNILEATSSSSSTILPSWIQEGENATLFLNDTMARPSNGKLYQDSDGLWIFCRGTS
jgi:hypothetical protein